MRDAAKAGFQLDSSQLAYSALEHLLLTVKRQDYVGTAVLELNIKNGAPSGAVIKYEERCFAPK